MADEKNIHSEDSKAPAKKKKKKKRSGGLKKWFIEMKSELKKVIWPTPKQIANNTLVALVVIVIASVVIWCFDQAAAQGVNALISLGG